jgi:hypothetical protein
MTRRTKWAIGGGVLAGVVFAAGASLGFALRPDSGAHVLAQTADEWAAFGTVGTLFIAAVAAVIAFAQAAEARRLRLDQAQPYVVAYMEQNPNSPTLVELVIRNFGTTAARNVQITSDPTIRRTTDAEQSEEVWLPSGIPVLVPQQEWRTYWDSGLARKDHPTLSGANRHVVTVTYDGVERTPRQASTSVIDWGAYVGRMYMATKTVHHAAGALGEIAKTLGKWTEGPDGLSVYTRDGHAKDTRDAAAHKERTEQLLRLRDRLIPNAGSETSDPPDGA